MFTELTEELDLEATDQGVRQRALRSHRPRRGLLWRLLQPRPLLLLFADLLVSTATEHETRRREARAERRPLLAPWWRAVEDGDRLAARARGIRRRAQRARRPSAPPGARASARRRAHRARDRGDPRRSGGSTDRQGHRIARPPRPARRRAGGRRRRRCVLRRLGLLGDAGSRVRRAGELARRDRRIGARRNGDFAPARIGWCRHGDVGACRTGPASDVDLIVAVPAAEEVEQLAGLNERCLREGATPWLAVLPTDGRFAAVGPLYVPEQTACHACYLLRRGATSGYEQDFSLLDGLPVRAPMPPAASTIEAGLAALICLRWLGARDPTLPGRASTRSSSTAPSDLTTTSGAPSAPLSGVRRAVATTQPVVPGARCLSCSTPRRRRRRRRARQAGAGRLSAASASCASHPRSWSPRTSRACTRSRAARERSNNHGSRHRRVRGVGPRSRRPCPRRLDRRGDRAVLRHVHPRRVDDHLGCESSGTHAVAARVVRALPRTAACPRLSIRAVHTVDPAVVRRGIFARRRPAGLPPGAARLPSPCPLRAAGRLPDEQRSRLRPDARRGRARRSARGRRTRRDDARLGEPALACRVSPGSTTPTIRAARASRCSRRPGSGTRRSTPACSSACRPPIGVVHGADGDRAAIGIGAGCAPTIGDAWRIAARGGVLRPSLAAWSARRRTTTDRACRGRSLARRPHALPRDARRGRPGWRSSRPPANERSTTDVADVPGTTPGEIVVEIVRRLGEQGISAYAVDVTSPDVEELGLKVARVITPQLCALDVFGAAPYRGGERLYRAAFEARLVHAPLTYDDLNPLPHPYP